MVVVVVGGGGGGGGGGGEKTKKRSRCLQRESVAQLMGPPGCPSASIRSKRCSLARADAEPCRLMREKHSHQTIKAAIQAG